MDFFFHLMGIFFSVVAELHDTKTGTKIIKKSDLLYFFCCTVAGTRLDNCSRTYCELYYIFVVSHSSTSHVV